MEALILNGHDLSPEALHQVVYDRRPVEIAPEALERAKKARQIFFDMAAEGKPVYGLNRGKHLSSPGFTGLNRFLSPVDVKTIAQALSR